MHQKSSSQGSAGKGNLSFISLVNEIKVEEEELLLLSSLTLYRLISAIIKKIKKCYEDKIWTLSVSS